MMEGAFEQMHKSKSAQNHRQINNAYQLKREKERRVREKERKKKKLNTITLQDMM